MQGIHGRHTHREFRRVGAADNDRASAAQIAHYGRIAGRDQVRESGESVRRRLALHVDVHLDCHRYTEQRSMLGNTLERAIGSGRLSERLIGEIGDDRVQLRVQRADPFGNGDRHR